MQKLAGNTALFIFPLCMLFVFLTHSAEYESWSLPLAIILIVPMSLLCALVGVRLRGMDNNIFTQIGFIVLAGLACKNAVLIIEFAKQQEEHGHAQAFEAALERLEAAAASDHDDQLRIHPRRRAAHARHRRRRRNASHSGHGGLLAACWASRFFGIFLTPVFYLVIRWVSGNKPLGKLDHGNGETQKPEHQDAPALVDAH